MKTAIIYYARLLLDIAAHAGLSLAALSFSYNSYKGYVIRSVNEFPGDLKTKIKATFIWAVFVFTAIYAVSVLRSAQRSKMTLKAGQYAAAVVGYMAVVNAVFFIAPSELGVLIVLNVSALYLAFLIVLWSCLRKLASGVDTTGLAPRLIPPLFWEIQWVRDSLASGLKNPAMFILGFILLIMLAALLHVSMNGKAAVRVVNVAYFMLAAGVSIGFYQFFKENGKGEKKD